MNKINFKKLLSVVNIGGSDSKTDPPHGAEEASPDMSEILLKARGGTLSLEYLKRLSISETNIVFDPKTGNSFYINDTAGLILKGLQANKSPHALQAAIAKQYVVDPTVLERDFLEFIDQIKDLGLA